MCDSEQSGVFESIIFDKKATPISGKWLAHTASHVPSENASELLKGFEGSLLEQLVLTGASVDD